MTSEEEEIIRADERARVVYILQRRFRIMYEIGQEGRPGERDLIENQARIDLIGWLVEQFDPNEGWGWNRTVYDHVAPPNNQTPRVIEPNTWKITWR